jgi:hypothetical protein
MPGAVPPRKTTPASPGQRGRSPWHRLRGLLGADRARLRPARQWSLSLLLFGAFTGLGWSALPSDLSGAKTALRLEDPTQNGTGIATPVFLLRSDGAAVRFGDAAVQAGGIVRVGLYDPLDPRLTQATVAVSLPADGRLLWLLAAPDERQTLRDKASAVILGLVGSAAEITRSPAFETDYREPLMQILHDAVQAAWTASRDNGAWQGLLRSYEPVLRTVSSRDLRPIIERNFRGVALRMLKANTLTMLDPFHDHEWNMEPVEQALRESIDEIRDRDIPEQTAVRLLEMPQTAEFLRGFTGVAITRLAHDAALQDLIAQMVYDLRFRSAIQPAIDGLVDLGRTAPRLLVSLHGSTDLNLVAAAALRATISGRRDRTVVFMSPRQRDELMALDPAVVHILEPVGRNGS